MSLKKIANNFFESLRPPKKLSLSEWADTYAVLSAESSAEPGRWHTLPYQKGIMNCFTDPKIEEIWVMKSARVGFTKILNHVVGYHIHQAPCSMMLVQPTIEDAEGYSKEEIAPMIRDTPALRGQVSEAKAKDGNNTILAKNFPGGTLGLVGANSPRGFRRVSRKIVLFDEIDGYPLGAGEEGDQIKLGKKRTEYFWDRKVGGGSTPTVKDVSRIEALFLSGDQRRFFVPCPECGEFQYLKWANIRWPDDKPEEAFYACEKNGCIIDHSKKRDMIYKGEWRATAKSSDSKRVSFHIWAAYSLSPNASWGQLAKEFIEAKVDPQLLKTFINTALGEPWEEEYSSKLGAHELAQRAELYPQGQGPLGVMMATAGVDVQDNRIEISKYGWGKDEECWTLSHEVIMGDLSRPDIWKQLDETLSKKIPLESGGNISLSAACIDSGGSYTHQVYQFCRERKPRNYLAIKGQSQRGKPAIGAPTKVDINFKNQLMKSGGMVYPVGSDTVKDILYGRLKLSGPGAGYIHFPSEMPEEFFNQLTAEKKITKYVRGFPQKEWIKKNGARNETLDCFVYAYAALQFVMSRYHRPTFWTQLESKFKNKQGDLNENKGSNGHNNGNQKTISSGKKNFISSW
jgi:phage terminase large subunit GpA-like protein